MIAFPWAEQPCPFVTTTQMIEVDRAMIEDYHIELIQMMENAGRNLAHLARRRFLTGDPAAKSVAVLAGPGGNGGGALVCARRLHNWGAAVTVYLSRDAAAYTPVPAHQLDIVDRLGLPVVPAGSPAPEAAFDLLIDGLIGYSLQGSPRGGAADLIRWSQDRSTPVLALDAPSGVDATSGVAYPPAIQATATLTLALPKEGLRAPAVKSYVGELYLADISVPPQLYRRPPLNLDVGPLFAASDIIRLW